jgi:serine protease Do
VRSTSLGSGFIIDEEGYILTNAHVIRGGNRGISVRLWDGTQCDAGLMSVDTDNDVALLKISPPRDHPLVRAPLGTSSDLMVGESVIAIGNPLGHENSVSTGIVSSMFRDVPVAGMQARHTPTFKDFIQIDAPINPGNSGGPLLNAVGEVIGINFAIDQNAQGIGFAIPIDRVRHSLIDNLRLQSDVFTGLEIRGDDMGRDVRLANVTPDSPAAAAGLQAGDQLLEVARQPIEWEFDFNKALLHSNPGDRVPVVVQRDGRRINAELELRRYESPIMHLWRVLGLRVVDHPKYRGVRVDRVDPTGPGAMLGVQPGDLIDGIDEQVIDDTVQLYDAVRGMPSGQRIVLHVWRGASASQGTLVLR